MISNVKDEDSRCNTNLHLLHHSSKGGLQSPHLPGGVLLLDNHHLIATSVEDSDGLGSRLLTFNLFHLVLLRRDWRHHRGFRGRIAGPTTLYDASGGAICSSGMTGLAAPDSGAASTSPAFAAEDPAASVIAPGTIADPSAVGATKFTSSGS